MKKLSAVAFIVAAFAVTSSADIQDPPSNDYGPTRKLGRGLSNLLFAPSEAFVSYGKVNKEEGNSAGWGYGVVRGLSRSAERHIAGFLELVTWPFPAWHESYYPLLPDDTRYIHAGFSEFPPELGNESKYPYVRDY